MPRRKPVDEHAGDPAAIGRDAGLLLDDRGQRQRLVGAVQRRRRIALLPRLGEAALHRAVGALEHREVARRPCCTGRCRGESALRARRRRRRARSSPRRRSCDAMRRLERLGARELGADLAKGPALVEAHRGERLVAAHHLVEQADRRRAGADLVAAGADLARLGRTSGTIRRAAAATSARRRAPRPRRSRAASGRARSRPRRSRAASVSGRVSQDAASETAATAAASATQQQETPESHRQATEPDPVKRQDPRLSTPWRLMIMAPCPTEISIGGVCRLADRGVIRAQRRRRRDLPAGPAHQRRREPRRRRRRASPASARRRAGCRRASSSGGRPTTSSCSRARASVLAPTLKRLSMFVLRAKCKLSDASDEIALFGVAGPAATRDARRCRGLATTSRTAAPRSIRLPDAAGLQRALPRRAGRRRGRRRRRAGDDPRDLALARGRRAASSRSKRRRSTASCRRWSTSSSSAASTSRRAAIPARRSSRAASTAARPSAAPSSSTATRCRPPGEDVFVAGDVDEPAGTVANAAPHPEQRGGSALVEVRLAALGADLRLGSADGPPLRQRPLPYSVPLDVTDAGLSGRDGRARALRLVPRAARATPTPRAPRSSPCSDRLRSEWPGLQARAPRSRRRRDVDLDGDLFAAGASARRRRRHRRGDRGRHRRRRAGRSRRSSTARATSRLSRPSPPDAARLQSARSISTWAMPASSNSGPRRTKPARS